MTSTKSVLEPAKALWDIVQQKVPHRKPETWIYVVLEKYCPNLKWTIKFWTVYGLWTNVVLWVKLRALAEQLQSEELMEIAQKYDEALLIVPGSTLLENVANREVLTNIARSIGAPVLLYLYSPANAEQDIEEIAMKLQEEGIVVIYPPTPLRPIVVVVPSG